MKVTIENKDAMTAEEAEEAEEIISEGKEATDKEFKEIMLKAKEISLSPQVVNFAKNELGLTPDEFVAMLLKEAGATQ